MNPHGFLKFLFSGDDGSAQNPALVSKILMINVIASLLILLGIVVIIECIYMRLDIISVTIAFGVILGVMTLCLSFKTKRIFLCGNLVTLDYAMVVIYSNIYIGGIGTSTFLWLFLIPVLAGVMISKSYLFYYTLLTFITMTFFSIIYLYGFEPIYTLTGTQEKFIAISDPILLTLSFAAISYYFIRIRDLFENSIIDENLQLDHAVQKRTEKINMINEQLMQLNQHDALIKQLLATSNQANTIDDFIKHIISKLDRVAEIKVVGIYDYDKRHMRFLKRNTINPNVSNELSVVNDEVFAADHRRLALLIEEITPVEYCVQQKDALVKIVGGDNRKYCSIFPIKISNELAGIFVVFSSFPEEENSQLFNVMEEMSLPLGFILERENYQNELMRSREIAESASRAKDEFLANMSHEIKTPMNAVINMIKLIDKTQLNSKQKEYVDVLDHSSSLLLKIIDDVLSLSKLESGYGDIERRQFNVNHLINMIIAVFRDKFIQKNVSFVVDISPKLPECIETDELKLNQVLINLISNALKFTQLGKVILRCELNESISDKCLMTISVIDTGEGISEENQHKIFNKFTQADNSMTRQFSGVGLGLSISKQLVALLGGGLLVDSIENQGSRFYFSIPISVESTDTEVIKKAGRVLLFSSLTAQIAVYERYFQSMGYQTFQASSMSQSELIEHDYDILFLADNSLLHIYPSNFKVSILRSRSCH